MGASGIYTLLYGAKKNAGDFLIYERAKGLIEDGTGVSDFVEYPRWRPLDPILDQANRSRAVILCGGPGYREDFHPGIFPLSNPFSRLEVPVVPMGLGWSGIPMDNPEAFTFTQVSLEALKRIHERIRYSSVRDPITLEILQRHGVDNVLMTGDPAWYSLPDLHKDYRPPSAIRRIVISEPATPRLYPQAVRLLREVRRLFPRSERFLVFHRGLRADEHTPRVKSAATRTLSLVARIQGYTPIDASYGTDQIAFYRDCDLHVGYRVHAHLYFLSIRKPSFLIMEDGRGVGQTRALGLPGVSAFEPHPVASVMELLHRNIADDFEAPGAAVARMRETYPVMERFISSLP